MIRKLLLSLALVVGLCSPTDAKNVIAVFADPGLARGWTEQDKSYVDVFYVAQKWDNFDSFLKMTQAIVKPGDGLIIELNVHGGQDCLYLDYYMSKKFKYSSRASEGFIVNHIEKVFLKQEKLIILQDSCFAGNVYKDSIRNCPKELPGDERIISMRQDDRIEDCDHIPFFPIFGSGSGTYTWSHMIFKQFLLGLLYYWEDLRSYEVKIPFMRDWNDSSPLNMAVYFFSEFLNQKLLTKA